MVLILAFILCICTYLFYTTAKIEIENTYRVSAETIAFSMANVIEESAEEYKYLLETYDTESKFYKDTYKAFNDIASGSMLAYIYTVDWYNENEIKFIIDCVPLDDKNSTPIGTVYEMGEYAKEAFETKKTSNSGFEYYESWGDNYLSTFAPIIDPETNEVLGLVGVDIQIDELISKLNLLKFSAASTLFAILMIAYVLLAKFSDRLIRPYVFDELTKVYNRKFFNDYIGKVFTKNINANEPISFLVIDIDHFKKINDTYGHAFGDVTLREMSAAIAKKVSKNSCFARYGGEEFVLSLENTSEDDAQIYADKLRKHIEELTIYNKDINENILITISIGVACSSGHNVISYTDLLEKSDKALYLAKKDNRNCVRTYSDVKNSLI